MIQLDINILLGQGLIQDDAFYYFEIAKYFLATGTPSFDGIHATNGFHPLWQAICLPVFYFWQGEVPLRIMLAVASVLDLLSIVLLYSILNRLTRKEWVALCGVAIMALHGTIIRTWFNGMETALHIFTLLLFLQHYLKVIEKPFDVIKDHVWLGILAAMAFLSRTDSAVIIAIMFGFLYIPSLLRKNISPALLAASVIILLIAPWLLWNYQQFDSIVQISGKMSGNAWLTGGNQATENPFYIDIAQGVISSINPLGNVIKKMFIPVPCPDWAGYLFILPLVAITLFSRKKQPDFSAAFSRLWPFFFGVLVLFFYHAGVRSFIRSWYSAPLLLALILLLCLLLNMRLSVSRRTVIVSSLILIAALMGVYSPYRYTRSPAVPSQDPRIAASQWLNQNTSHDARVGSANAGIVGYYTERPVINLDGVVNESAFHARIDNQIHRYVYESGIEYLADHKGTMAHLCADNIYYRCEESGRWDNATVVARVIRIPQAPHIHNARSPEHPAI